MRKIDHLVVLMLENRSFDSVLGTLYPAGPNFDGLTGSESNPLHPDQGGPVSRIAVWNDAERGPEDACIPDPDPGELFQDINVQIFGLNAPPGSPARMIGFVDNYVRQPSADKRCDPRSVMHYFTSAQVPVTSGLGRAFGVSDRWYGSAPCQTWPNRLFAHTGTAAGKVNNSWVPFPYFLPTIFRQLERGGQEWRVYFHDIPQTAALADLWVRLPKHFRLFQKEFARDAAAGRLPAYSFIEPRYFPGFVNHEMPNDGHPPHSMVYAEQLVAAVYGALRHGAAWDRTLLVVIYDEHGGCYDHAVPPPAVPPGPPYPDGFLFDRYGPRVPAILASPWIPGGSVLRPPHDGAPFDHTSIISTLQRLFDLGPPVNPRVASAPDLLSSLSLPAPTNLGPPHLDVSDTGPGKAELHQARKLPRNGHQKRLLHPTSLIPGLVARGFGHAHGVRAKFRSRHK